MPHIAVPEDIPGIGALLAYRPHTAKPLSELAEVLLRGESTLSRGERELIAAYVSSRNECVFCTRSHSAFAGRQLEGGVALVEAVKADFQRAPISDKMKALIAIARKVQRDGAWTPEDPAAYEEMSERIVNEGYLRR